MNIALGFPSFDERLPELDRFIMKLTKDYTAGNITSWENLDELVKKFFTPEQMKKIEGIAPGWKKMAAYAEGITLTHVSCVFLGMFMLPEFQSLTHRQQQIAKWIILFHDIDKFHTRGKRDTMHAFRSGIIAAKDLPSIGFPVTDEYYELIDSWSKLTYNAFIDQGEDLAPKPNNRKLPEILMGISRLFGENTPAALIVKTVLLHISLNVDINYPTPSPLSVVEIERYIDPIVFPLLRVMMLSDNEGWSMFDPEVRAQQRNDTLRSFAHIKSLINVGGN